MKRLFCMIIAAIITSLSLASCNRAPEYSEINASYARICPVPQNTETSDDYTLEVAGEKVELYKTGDEAFGIIRSGDAVNVSLKCDKKVESATISPAARHNGVKIHGKTISFSAQPKATYIITVNGEQKVYLINDKDITISSAEDDIYFKQGVNKSSVSVKETLALESDTTYVLQYGAVLDGAVLGENVSNVRIVGGGVITSDISLSNCSDIEINGVICEGAVDVKQSENVFFDNVKIISDKKGVEISSSENIEIANSFIKSEGDSVAVKNIPAEDGSLDTSVCKNISVTDCVMETHNGHSMLIGHQTVGKRIESVTFKNITVANNIGGVAMAIYNSNNSQIYKTKFDTVTVENAQPEDDRRYLIDVRNMFSLEHSTEYGETEIGSIDNLQFCYVELIDGRNDIGINITGCKENRVGYPAVVHKVSNVWFKECSILGSTVFKSYYYMNIGNYTEGFSFE